MANVKFKKNSVAGRILNHLYLYPRSQLGQNVLNELINDIPNNVISNQLATFVLQNYLKNIGGGLYELTTQGLDLWRITFGPITTKNQELSLQLPKVDKTRPLEPTDLHTCLRPEVLDLKQTLADFYQVSPHNVSITINLSRWKTALTY